MGQSENFTKTICWGLENDVTTKNREKNYEIIVMYTLEQIRKFKNILQNDDFSGIYKIQNPNEILEIKTKQNQTCTHGW